MRDRIELQNQAINLIGGSRRQVIAVVRRLPPPLISAVGVRGSRAKALRGKE